MHSAARGASAGQMDYFFSKSWRAVNVLNETSRENSGGENLQQLQAKQLHIDITDIPSLASLEVAFRLVRAGKATGPDS